MVVGTRFGLDLGLCNDVMQLMNPSWGLNVMYMLLENVKC
jgi:hypothetical protein